MRTTIQAALQAGLLPAALVASGGCSSPATPHEMERVIRTHADRERSEALLRERLEDRPDDLGAALALSHALDDAGRRAAARAVLDPFCQGSADPRALVRRARLAESEADAERLAREACDRNPGGAEGWSTLAGILVRTGRSQAAEAPARKATELARFDPQAWMMLANALAYQGRRGEAVPAVEQALLLDLEECGDGRNHYLAALADLYRNVDDDACAALYAASGADTQRLEDRPWSRLPPPVDGLPLPLTERFPEARLDAGLLKLLEAARASGEGDFHSTLALAQAASALLGTNLRAARLEILALIGLGRLDEAESAARKFGCSDPACFPFYMELALARKAKHDPDGAARILERASAARPEDGRFPALRGIVEFEQGGAEQAERHFERALTLGRASWPLKRLAAAIDDERLVIAYEQERERAQQVATMLAALSAASVAARSSGWGSRSGGSGGGGYEPPSGIGVTLPDPVADQSFSQLQQANYGWSSYTSY